MNAPNNLQKYVRKTPGDNKLDLSVIMKAEEALESISSDHLEWLSKHLETLRELRGEIEAQNLNEERSTKLFYMLQDLKDCAPAFGYHYVAKAAGSLADVLEEVPYDKVPPQMIDYHLSAIFAMVNEQAKGDMHRMAHKLTMRLIEVTKDFLTQPQR